MAGSSTGGTTRSIMNTTGGRVKHFVWTKVALGLSGGHINVCPTSVTERNCAESTASLSYSMLTARDGNGW